MTEEREIQQPLWYVRRGQVVKGPFPSAQITRFVALGRVRPDDDLSRDKVRWQRLDSLPQLIPELLRNGQREGLEALRRREDERQPGDRRQRGPDPSPEIMERRRKTDRRRPEPEEAVKRRQSKGRFIAELRKRSARNYVPLWIGTALTIVLILVFGVLAVPPPVESVPDCNAPAAPSVNWNNCRMENLKAGRVDLTGAHIRNARLREAELLGARLHGADLAYTELVEANLSYADLAGADLKGANLQRADLAYADLSDADLSYADLQGANLGASVLKGTRLDNAVWTDGSLCQPGSVGDCLPSLKGR